MAEGDTTPQEDGSGTSKTCERCSSAMELLTRLPATSENPGYRIFSCAACSFTDWIAEQVTGE
jgi:hypothetical protein